ncbi:MAG: sulfur carrier protein ThiS [Burkholderiales bacterium]|nr:sulfur carrier protein ThiS [Burkholderiales bacterium]
MELWISGESKRFEAPLPVSDLVERLGLAGRRIAVELNAEILPRSRFESTMLADGDRLEIVTAVGGG